MIAGLAALIIGTQSIARQLRAAGDDATARCGRWVPGQSTIIADGLPGRWRRWPPGLCLPYGRRRIVTVLAVRAGAGGGSRARVYLDWAVLGLGSLVLVPGLGGVAAVSPTGRRRTGPPPATSRRASQPLRAGSRRRRGCRPPGVRGPEACPGPGARAHCGAGPLGHGRGGAGHDRSHRHAHLRRQPDRAGFPSGTVRVELQLRLLRGPGLGRRARPVGRPTAGP